MDRDTDPTIAETLEEELVRLIARGSRRSAVPVICAAAVIAGAAYGKAPTGLVAVWFVVAAAIVMVRRTWLTSLLGIGTTTARRQLRIIAGFAALTGGSFGASVAFWPYLGALEKAVETTVVIGLCAASVATNLGYRPTFLVFFACAAGPVAVAWLAGSSTGHERWIEVAMALLIALFGYVLTMLARDSFGLFAASFAARREQQRLNGELRIALDDADAASRAKTRFLASASHDLRQPLHTVSLFGAALLMRPLDPRTRQIAEHMHTALQSLGSQLDALLDISKLDAGVIEAQPRWFALQPLFAAIEADFAPQAAAKGLHFVLTCPSNLSCLTDPTLLGRIVRNLVDNAIKYTETGSIQVLAFDTATPGPSGDERLSDLRIEVADTGIGIDASEQQHVFEEFYQVGNSERDRARGLGLGLSIVARLAALLTLGVTLDSSAGHGTTIRLALPLSARRAVAPQAPVADEVVRLVGLRALVVDDEHAVREGMRTLLQGWGWVVDIAGDTSGATLLAAAARPDIVLADLRLRAGDDGIATIASLRQRHPGLPALLISGDTAPQRLRDAMAAGLRLLHKPVSAALLQQAIGEEIERSGGTVHEGRPPASTPGA
ncbi:MAG: hybrid sensor histidine kinase/response regulator [Pseudomonadota bacterium]